MHYFLSEAQKEHDFYIKKIGHGLIITLNNIGVHKLNKIYREFSYSPKVQNIIQQLLHCPKLAKTMITYKVN